MSRTAVGAIVLTVVLARVVVGRASAQNEPVPPQGVSETLEAAKLGAFARET